MAARGRQRAITLLVAGAMESTNFLRQKMYLMARFYFDSGTHVDYDANTERPFWPERFRGNPLGEIESLLKDRFRCTLSVDFFQHGGNGHRRGVLSLS